MQIARFWVRGHDAGTAATSLSLPKFFLKVDGSIHDRLNTAYNETKHFDARIDKGQMDASGNAPLWFSANGLRTSSVMITFAELRDALVDQANLADKIIRLDSGSEDGGELTAGPN